MRFDDEHDWHAPHPSDRAEVRDRLLTAVGLALVLAALVWGVTGYKGLWEHRSFPAIGSEAELAQPEQQLPVAP